MPIRLPRRLRGAARLLALAAAGAGAASCSDSTGSGFTLPQTLVECETNTATVCGEWTLSGGRYLARWDQGSEAVIEIERFDGRSAVFVRDDPSGSSAGMHAVYTGRVTGRSIRGGTVVWSHNGQVFSGTWRADW